MSSYKETGSIDPKVHYARNHYRTTDDILQHIEYIKTRKPSTYRREIKNRLLELGVCDDNTVPSRQTISHVLRHELNFIRKRLTIIPDESLTDAAQEKQVRFLKEICISWMNVAWTGHQGTVHTDILFLANMQLKFDVIPIQDLVHLTTFPLTFFGIFQYKPCNNKTIKRRSLPQSSRDV